MHAIAVQEFTRICSYNVRNELAVVAVVADTLYVYLHPVVYPACWSQIGR